MRIRISNRPREDATTLVICLISATLLGIALASYLALTQGEYLTVVRSQAWNRTMAVAEAGTEEGMALINKYAGTPTPLANWTNTAISDGWTVFDNGVYYLNRHIGPDYYDVFITNLNNAPAIKSIGTLAWNYRYASAASSMFAAVGTPALNTSRAVLVQTAAPQSYFLYSILAKKGITLSGGTVDSINSLETNYPANFWSQTLEHANGSVGTLENNLLVGSDGNSAMIFGHAHTGPRSVLTINNGGGIGDTTWLTSNPGRIEPGWTNNTLNIAIPDPPQAPNALYLPMPLRINNTYILTGLPGTTTFYEVRTGTEIGNGTSVLITNGAVVLKFDGDFTLSDGSSISIANGSSLTAFFNGKTILSGGGVINGTGYSTNCTFYGSPTCTAITYSGSSGFIGTVNAPEAAYTQSGNAGFIGALIVNSFSQSGGKALLRYDEALGNLEGPGAVYRVVAWQEVALCTGN